jgi:hypothetical protein
VKFHSCLEHFECQPLKHMKTSWETWGYAPIRMPGAAHFVGGRGQESGIRKTVRSSDATSSLVIAGAERPWQSTCSLSKPGENRGGKRQG